MTLVKAGSSSGKADVIMDVIVIDEISMLTTSALHGVNQALNYVMTSGARAPSRDMLFGKKSVVAVGDLYQLPSVEKGAREQQVYQSCSGRGSRVGVLPLELIVLRHMGTRPRTGAPNRCST